MTVLSQARGLVERWRTVAPTPGNAYQIGLRDQANECADALQSLVPAIEAQQEYIEKVESVKAELLRIEASMVAADDKDAAWLHWHWGHSLGVVINRLYGPRYDAIVITTHKPADQGEGI